MKHIYTTTPLQFNYGENERANWHEKNMYTLHTAGLKVFVLLSIFFHGSKSLSFL